MVKHNFQYLQFYCTRAAANSIYTAATTRSSCSSYFMASPQPPNHKSSLNFSSNKDSPRPMQIQTLFFLLIDERVKLHNMEQFSFPIARATMSNVKIMDMNVECEWQSKLLTAFDRLQRVLCMIIALFPANTQHKTCSRISGLRWKEINGRLINLLCWEAYHYTFSRVCMFVFSIEKKWLETWSNWIFHWMLSKISDNSPLFIFLWGKVVASFFHFQKWHLIDQQLDSLDIGWRWSLTWTCRWCWTSNKRLLINWGERRR